MGSRPSRQAKVTAATVFHFEEAIAASRHHIVAAPPLYDLVPLQALRRATEGPLYRIRDLIVHPLILFIAIRHHRADLIIVRYFTTKMLLLAAGLLWPFRKKLLFMIQNNMQVAHVGSRERRYFKALCRLGFQFGFLEAADGLAELGVEVSEQQFVSLPMPIYPPHGERTAAKRNGPPSIGVIGRELPEKNTDQLLSLLLAFRESGDLDAEIVLGSNDAKVLETWARRGVRAVPTLDYADYLRAIAEVDVLLIHYDRQHYFYRSSGVIHDAACAGTAVVCPNFPVFRFQVTAPVRVGAVFDSAEEMLPALREALEIVNSEPDHFATWAWARRPEEFSRRIDRFIDCRRRAIAA
ncbi:MAG: hypothetical protein R3D25_05395 [Geminicoccaceae bacterium]